MKSNRKLKPESNFKTKMSSLDRSFKSNKDEISVSVNNTCNLPDAHRRRGPQFASISKDLLKSPVLFKRPTKDEHSKNVACDHYNTNVGFGTQTKIIQRLHEQKRDCLFTQLHQRTNKIKATKANN